MSSIRSPRHAAVRRVFLVASVAGLLVSCLPEANTNLNSDSDVDVTDSDSNDTPNTDLPTGELIVSAGVSNTINPYSIDDIGVPTSDQRLDYSSFSIGYNYSRKHADWVGAALLPELVRLFTPRVDSFYEETQIPAQYRATLEDYRNSGYDRGHLAPNATHDQSTTSMEDTFTLANMSPQLAGFNRFDWAQLESYIRDCVADNSDGTPLFVFTGPYYGTLIEEVGDSKIPVPEGYYKVVYSLSGSTATAMAFQTPHVSFEFDNLKDYIVTVDRIEELTGLDFASAIPDAMETELESTVSEACPID